jgi:hypothetical protein
MTMIEINFKVKLNTNIRTVIQAHTTINMVVEKLVVLGVLENEKIRFGDSKTSMR